VLGVFYNKLLLGLVSPKCPLQKISAPLRALGIGVVVGLVAWFLPDDASGGDPLTQKLLQGYGSIGLLLTIALVRFFLGPLSYAAGTPGGLFAPAVALGALLGAAAGLVLHEETQPVAPAAAIKRADIEQRRADGHLGAGGGKLLDRVRVARAGAIREGSEPAGHVRTASPDYSSDGPFWVGERSLTC
jgi:hypothetical protein